MAKLENIVIVGGGIAGAATALELQRRGRHVTILERAPELKEVGAGVSIWWNAVGVLEQLGLRERVFGGCTQVVRNEVLTSDGELIKSLDYRAVIGAIGGSGYIVKRADLLDALVSQLDASCIRTNAAVARLERAGFGARVWLASGEAIDADVVIGADGLNSAVRQFVVGDGPPRYSGETCFRGLARASVGSLDTGREFLGVRRRASYFGMRDDLVYWGAVLRAPEGEACPQADRAAHVLAEFSGWPEEVLRLVRATDPLQILHNDLYDRPPVRSWHRGPVVLIGDAAHPTTPHMGQGACMALEDAAVLAKELHAATDLERAFESFERQRMERTAWIADTSRIWGRFLNAESSRSARLKAAIYRWTPAVVFTGGLRKQFSFDAKSCAEGVSARPRAGAAKSRGPAPNRTKARVSQSELTSVDR